MTKDSYTLSALRAMKPAHMGAKQWDRFVRQPNGIQVLALRDDELVAIPLGAQTVRNGQVRQLGTLSVETGKPIKRVVSKKISARQAKRLFGHGGYEYNATQPEIVALAKSAEME
jgi:hypothetical protein